MILQNSPRYKDIPTTIQYTIEVVPKCLTKNKRYTLINKMKHVSIVQDVRGTIT